MEFITLWIVLCFLSWTWFYFLSPNSTRRKGAKLPPGPYPFPIIGNMHQLGQQPHRSLTKLSKTHGPIMSLHLGNVYTIVVSSPEMAKEILQKHDQVFSGRTIAAAAQAHDHGKLSVAYLPMGDTWRKIRKICKEQMFSNISLEQTHGLRQDKLKKLRDYVHKCSLSGRTVNINEAAFITTLNLMAATLFSAEFADFESDESEEFKEAIEGVARIVGLPNFADYFPVLRPFDPQGIKQKAGVLFGKLLGLIGDIINQRLEERRTSINGSPKKKDLLETLLDLSEGIEYKLSVEEIKHLLLDLFVAGSDTTASTTEWTMTELLLNPKVMSKAKDELMNVIGKNAQVQESDISRLPYLRAVIKEIFRYHPPGPFLIPRKAETDVEVNGYMIPKNTQIFVNVWAMGRDSSFWSNPNSFEPERFLDKKTDFKGQDFELIPFGSGRRICPAVPLANRMLHLTVATLVHNFDWKFEAGNIAQELDMKERFGLSLRKDVSLKAIPVQLV